MTPKLPGWVYSDSIVEQYFELCDEGSMTQREMSLELGLTESSLGSGINRIRVLLTDDVHMSLTDRTLARRILNAWDDCRVKSASKRPRKGGRKPKDSSVERMERRDEQARHDAPRDIFALWPATTAPQALNDERLDELFPGD